MYAPIMYDRDHGKRNFKDLALVETVIHLLISLACAIGYSTLFIWLINYNIQRSILLMDI